MADLHVSPSTPSGLSTGSGNNRARPASIVSGLSNAGPRKLNVQAEFDFNLGSTKAKVFKTLDDSIPITFKKFFNTQLYDRLLQNLMLYFISLYQYEWLIKAMERARRSHLEGYNPYTVALRLREMEEEMAMLKKDLSPIYSEIILKHSTYEKAQQDRLFFESTYGTLVDILDEAMSKLGKRKDIEAEVGAMFRTRHFNLYKRRNEPPRSVDTLQIKELYSLKHEVTNRALNAKMLTSLYEKPPSIAVQVASVSNTPLISQFIMSPIVARSMMKDPSQRNKMYRRPQSVPVTMGASELEGADLTRSGTSRFKSAVKPLAVWKGVDVVNLRDHLTHLKPSAGTESVIGLAPVEKALKAEVRKSSANSATAPESVGLPVDEIYTHLLLLKRYILFGPTMGMPTNASSGTSVLHSAMASSNRAFAAAMPSSGKQLSAKTQDSG